MAGREVPLKHYSCCTERELEPPMGIFRVRNRKESFFLRILFILPNNDSQVQPMVRVVGFHIHTPSSFIPAYFPPPSPRATPLCNLSYNSLSNDKLLSITTYNLSWLMIRNPYQFTLKKTSEKYKIFSN